MANFRITFFFESAQQGIIGASSSLGWTETWYYVSGGSIDTVIESSIITDYLQRRLAVLPTIYRATFVRVNDEAFPRRVKIANVTAQTGKALPAQTGADGQVQCALLVDLQRLPHEVNESVHHRRFLVRAVPSDIINGNVINPAGAHWGAMKIFLNFIGRHESGIPLQGEPTPPLSIRYHNPLTGPVLVTSISIDNVNQQRIRVQPDVPTWIDAAHAGVGSPPAQVKFRDVAAPLQNVNRTWTLLNRDTTGPATSMIFGTARRALPVMTVQGPLGVGFMQRVDWLYGPADQYAIIGLRNKRTGRVFRQLRGRSRNR